MRIAFMGTPDFAATALRALAAEHDVAAVYTQPPRPAGRGRKDRPTPVGALAAEMGLEARTPLNFRAEEDRAAFAALDLDAAVVVAYGLILPQPVLDAPREGCLNLHASLLPRWRGAAPIQRAIMAGDEETGVCVMRMEAGLDTGPVALTERTSIGPEDTAGSLHDRLAELGAPLMADALGRLADARLAFTAQTGEALYAVKIDKAEARIDWTRPAAEVDRHIRGLSPFPGAWFETDAERVKALMSETADGRGAPGQTLDGALTIACGEGAIRLTRLQRAGKAPMEARDYLRGRPAQKGLRLG